MKVVCREMEPIDGLSLNVTAYFKTIGPNIQGRIEYEREELDVSLKGSPYKLDTDDIFILKNKKTINLSEHIWQELERDGI